MCGRFALRANRGEIQAMQGYDADVDEWVNEDEFIPRYNIAPRSNAPVIRRRDPGPSGAANDVHLILQTMKWGLVPSWSKFEDKSLNTTNARSENLIERGGLWQSIKGKNRCAIPCQGYFEWLTKGKEKLPHFTKRKDGNLLLMAGLFDSVVLEGKTLWTFTIVTTDANPEFSWLHDRQPVFLTNHDALMKWLDTSSQSWTPELTKMVQPYHDSLVALECYAVPKEVGKIGTESPTFIEPVATRKDGIQAMFAKQKAKAETPKHSSPPSTPIKRKREDSPLPSSSQYIGMQDESPLPKKRIKSDESESSRSPKAERSPMKPKRQLSPSKQRKPIKAEGNAKIDSFFRKV